MEKTNLASSFKLSVEEELQKNNHDVYTVYGTRQSLSRNDQMISYQYFEDRQTAEERTKAMKKRKSDSDKIEFDREGLLEYVGMLPDGHDLNLTDLALWFNVPNKNGDGNKYVKDFLLRNNVDINRFNNKCDDTQRVRRKGKTISDTKITMPKPRKSRKLREGLKEEIKKGNIKLGRLVEPKIFTKVTLDDDGNIKTEEFEISGRKIPLWEVRHELSKDHLSLGLMRDSTLIKRYLSVWADHSTLLSHGYLLLTVNPLWTPTCYFTDDEVLARTGKKMNVQEVVEKPRLYIFAKSQDSILEKLSYVETRAEDIRELEWPTTNNDQIIHDHLRLFKGDHPEIQFEAGNSQGGTYKCLCGLEKSKFNDLEATLRSQIIDLDARRKIVTAGPSGKRNKVSPFENLSREEVLNELRCRDPPGWQKNTLADDLRTCLKSTLRGVNRLPSLLYGGHLTIENIPLYEVCPVEPLHDIKGHVTNLWDVIVNFFDEEQKNIFTDTIKACFGNKDKVRGCDYRFSAIVVFLQLKDKVSRSLMLLLESLVLVIKLASLPAIKRTPRTVLLTYNAVFIHALSVINVLGKDGKGKKVSNEKLYGIYSHAIFAHFPTVNRIIPLSSVHCESEERLFSKAKNISNSTSSRKLDHVRDNSIVRLQCEAKVHEQTSPTINTEWRSKISKFDKAVGPTKNTRIHEGMCSPRVYQAHLERISDYLLPGEGVWWHEDDDTGDIIFHDGDGEPETRSEGPQLKSFEDESFKTSHEYVKQCWDQCVAGDVQLPVRKVYIYSEEGDYLNTKHYQKKDYVPPPMTDDEGDAAEDAADIELDIETVATPLFPPMPALRPAIANQPNYQPRASYTNDLVLQHPDDTAIQSSVGKALLRVLGTSTALKKYDKSYRYSYLFPNEQTYIQEANSYREALGVKLRDLYSKANSWFTQWQEDFYLSRGKEPSPLDISDDVEAVVVHNKITITEKVLRKWNISFIN